MQPTLVAQLFHHKGWVYEEKVDGYRIVAYKDDDAVTIMSRQGKDHTSRFLDLSKALAALPAHSFILDGAVADFDQAHISRFEWLRARPKEGRATLPVYMVFDVLELDGKDWSGKIRNRPAWPGARSSG
jgi:bifunctional non-homologous end joining protein LigD